MDEMMFVYSDFSDITVLRPGRWFISHWKTENVTVLLEKFVFMANENWKKVLIKVQKH
jgi:hypothetical protein